MFSRLHYLTAIARGLPVSALIMFLAINNIKLWVCGTVFHLQRAVMLVSHFARQPKPSGRTYIPFPGWGRGTGGREQGWDEEGKREVPTRGMDGTITLESPEKCYCPSAAHHHCHHSTSVPNCTPSLYFLSLYCPLMRPQPPPSPSPSPT